MWKNSVPLKEIYNYQNYLVVYKILYILYIIKKNIYNNYGCTHHEYL